MAARSDVSVDWFSSPRIITVQSPSTEITIQDLLDTCREAEDDPANMVYSYLASAAGKENLGGGVQNGITVTLQNAVLAFEARPGPSYAQCTVRGGNIVAVDNAGANISPIHTTSFTQVITSGSSSATLLGVDASEIAGAVWDEPLSSHLMAGSVGEAISNAGLTPEQAKQLLLVFVNSL